MSDFDTILQDAVRHGVVPGAVAVAKSKDGSIELSYAASHEDGVYRNDTVLEIASLTKLLTAICALQLVEGGLITLDDDVAHLIPSFAAQRVLNGFDGDGKPRMQERRNTITLRLLLTHSAGAGYTFRDERLTRYQASVGKSAEGDGTVDGNFDFPLSYEPGQGFMYSSGMDRVGQIIEKVSGTKLDEYMRENIWQPLGIDSASFRGPSPPIAIRTSASEPAAPSPGVPGFSSGWKECSGGQGLLMHMQDYIKVLWSLLADDEKLLRRETAAKLFEPCLSTPASRSSLLEQMKDPTKWVIGDFPDTEEYDWSFGGLLINGDSHPYRKRNMVTWSGANNSYWLIDRTAGVCGAFGCQVLPPGDSRVRELITQFEKHVYSEAVGEDGE